jgi:hypothetical protein
VARALKTGRRIGRRAQPGLGRGSVVLVLGADFKGLAAKVAVPKPPPPRPPKPTRATRGLPSWDPRPC